MPTATPPPQFSLGRSLLFSSVLVLAFFGALEGGLRLVGVETPRMKPRLVLREMDIDITFPFMREDAEVFWSPRPGWKGEFRGGTVTLNSLGLRGPEIALPKPSGRTRLLCFGDSITFGYGVGDDETYSHFLGRALADRGVEVVNAGITGFTSHQVLRLLRRLAPAVQADAATVFIGWNDGNQRPVTDRQYERRLHASMAVEGTLDRLYVYKAIKSLYLRTLLKALPETPGTQRVPLGHYRENLEAIVGECRARGIRPAFVALAHRRKAGEPLSRTPYADALAEVADRLGVPLLEVGDLGLQTTLESNEPYFIDALHMSPAGNELLARELALQIPRQGLLGAGNP